MNFSNLRNTTAANDDSGTLSTLYGQSIAYGHNNTAGAETPQTTNVYGIQLTPYYRTGTIANLYDIYIGGPVTNGTVTNRWSIYQFDTTTRNYFGSKTGFNVTNPLAQLHVDQSVNDAAIPVLILDQADESEGTVNFIASARGAIAGATDSIESVRVELDGTVYRLALYADA